MKFFSALAPLADYEIMELCFSSIPVFFLLSMFFLYGFVIFQAGFVDKGAANLKILLFLHSR